MQNFNMIDHTIKSMHEDLIKKKEALLKQRFKERVGIEIDFEKEARRAFPRIKCIVEQATGTETYIWNDGSEQGLRLITFYRVNHQSNASNYTITAEINYR